MKNHRRRFRSYYFVYTVATRNIVSTPIRSRQAAQDDCDAMNSAARTRQYRVGTVAYDDHGSPISSRPLGLQHIPILRAKSRISLTVEIY